MFTININTEEGIYYFKDSDSDPNFGTFISWADDYFQDDTILVPGMPFFEDFSKLHIIIDKNYIEDNKLVRYKSFIINTPSLKLAILDWSSNLYAVIPTGVSETKISFFGKDLSISKQEIFPEVYCYIGEQSEQL